jgi:hypothetical protein
VFINFRGEKDCMKINMSKKVELWVVLLIIWLGLMFTIFFGWRAQAYGRGSRRLEQISKIIYSISKFPSEVLAVFNEVSKPSLLFVQNRWPEHDGFKKTKDSQISEDVRNDDGYVLISSTSPETQLPIVKLLRINDQKILNTWHLKKELIDEAYLTAQEKKEKNNRFIHPVLMPDGSIIFNLPNTNLLRINRFSEVIWKTNSISHHSIEIDSKGNLWYCSRNKENIYTDELLSVSTAVQKKSQDYNYLDDAIACVNSNGEEIFRKSVTTILIENGYRGLVLGASPFFKDPIHLNDVQPAMYSTQYWNEGDLLVSIRNRSTLFLYRPKTNNIIWLKTGPWLRQHDADFLDSSRIGVFSNNMLEGITPQRVMYEKVNTQYLFDFDDGTITKPFDSVFLEAGIRTGVEGGSNILENGDLFVEETAHGRLLRISKNSVIWEYTEPINEEYTARFCWSRYYSKNEIKEALELLTEE